MTKFHKNSRDTSIHMKTYKTLISDLEKTDIVPAVLIHKVLCNLDEYHKPAQENELRKYMEESLGINAYLFGQHHANEPIVDQFIHNNINYNIPILDSTMKNTGHNIIAYSGLSFDPRTTKSVTGHIHLPAYTSLSMSDQHGNGFAKAQNGTKHILQLRINSSDKSAYLGGDEFEILLPRNTTIKLHRSENHHYSDNTMVHHGTIDNTVPDERIEHNLERLKTMNKKLFDFYKTHPYVSSKVKEFIEKIQ